MGALVVGAASKLNKSNSGTAASGTTAFSFFFVFLTFAPPVDDLDDDRLAVDVVAISPSPYRPA